MSEYLFLLASAIKEIIVSAMVPGAGTELPAAATALATTLPW